MKNEKEPKIGTPEHFIKNVLGVFDPVVEKNLKELNELFDVDSDERINNRKPKKYSELMAILKKEHEETFPKITLEAQLDKFVDELEEFIEADNDLDEAREVADMLIVIAGVYRYAPRFAKEVLLKNVIDGIDEKDGYGRGIVTKMALEKSLINKERKWNYKDGKYQHK